MSKIETKKSIADLKEEARIRWEGTPFDGCILTYNGELTAPFVWR